MSEHFRQLVLSPEPADFTMNISDLLEILGQTGLIGEPITSCADKRFYVGPHFLQHISFMGCAPAIEFKPSERGAEDEQELAWHSFSFVYVADIFAHPVWYADLLLAKPVCPACGKRIASPADTIEADNSTLRCPHCQVQAPVCEFNWKEFGGCAQVMLSVVNVYPKEAIPSSNLLNKLAKLSDVEWRYFYINGSLPTSG
jgi:hypothetical protein